ncbi:hypothetical protein [Streptomyces sp. NPDC048737]|uniref:hypothetical protein n=1 Tax=unclassified Streptomyces TaxID=2593676 RepID=UPI00344989AD
MHPLFGRGGAVRASSDEDQRGRAPQLRREPGAHEQVLLFDGVEPSHAQQQREAPVGRRERVGPAAVGEQVVQHPPPQ